MRNGALLLLIAACMIVSPKVACAEDSDFPVGQQVTWETVNPKPEKTGDVDLTQETPNQRRRRLGEPLAPSFPPPEYGQVLETPNHYRQRMAATAEVATRR